MSQVLDERDDVEEAKADFKVAFLAPQVTRVSDKNGVTLKTSQGVSSFITVQTFNGRTSASAWLYKHP